MPESYNELVNSFKELTLEDKKQEILQIIYDELKLLYLENKKRNEFNITLPTLNRYSDDDTYYNLLFTYVMALREENDKLIETLEKMYWLFRI